MRVENKDRLLVCPECDLLHEVEAVEFGKRLHCARCDALLHQTHHRSLDRALSYSMAGLAFFMVANAFPILTFSMSGNNKANQLVDGSIELFAGPYWPLGVLVFITSVAAPLLVLILMASALLQIKMKHTSRFLKWQVKLIMHLKPWAMAEIFVIGIMVAYVKLGDFAFVGIGTSLVGIICMVVATVFTYSVLDFEELWQKTEEATA